MQPSQPVSLSQSSGFEPKWRHFSPLARVWVQNPFEDDIVYYVADDHNQQWKYVMRGGKVAELPGGNIATLGVKAIVDRLISDNPEDAARMWDLPVRAKYEKDILLRVKETNPGAGVLPGGEIDLTTNSSEAPPASVDNAPKAPEEAFPGLNQVAALPQLDALPPEAQAGISDLVSASLPATDDVASANNAHANIEG